MRAVQALGERGRPGEVYNVCDDRPCRRHEFYSRLAERLGAPPPCFAPPPATAEANRRIVNRRLRQEVGVTLAYPSFEEGLVACAVPPPT